MDRSCASELGQGNKPLMHARTATTGSNRQALATDDNDLACRAGRARDGSRSLGESVLRFLRRLLHKGSILERSPDPRWRRESPVSAALAVRGFAARAGP